MRLDRFQPWAEQTLNSAGHPALEAVAPGVEEVPCGTRVKFTGGAQIHIQWVRTSPPAGDNADQPEQITQGDPAKPAETPAPTNGGGLVVQEAEHLLAALLNNQPHPELADVCGYTQNPGLGSARQPYGLRVTCHSGAVIYGLFRHTLPAGQDAGRSTEFAPRKKL